jgi:DNA polymerase-3 subunit gamma/tau
MCSLPSPSRSSHGIWRVLLCSGLQAMARGEDVAVDLGVGTLLCRDRRPDFAFSPSLRRANSAPAAAAAAAAGPSVNRRDCSDATSGAPTSWVAPTTSSVVRSQHASCASQRDAPAHTALFRCVTSASASSNGDDNTTREMPAATCGAALQTSSEPTAATSVPAAAVLPPAAAAAAAASSSTSSKRLPPGRWAAGSEAAAMRHATFLDKAEARLRRERQLALERERRREDDNRSHMLRLDVRALPAPRAACSASSPSATRSPTSATGPMHPLLPLKGTTVSPRPSQAESTAMAAAKQAQKRAYAEALRSQMAARAARKEGEDGEGDARSSARAKGGSRPSSTRRPLAPNATPPPSPGDASCALEGEGEWEHYMLCEQRRLLSDVYL